MKKLRLSTIILVVVAMLLTSVVMVFAQDTDEAPVSAGGTVDPNGPDIPLPPHGGSLLLYDNGPLVNSAGTGAGGADESQVQTSLGMNAYGFAVQPAAPARMADDFMVTQTGGWQVETITVYAYQTDGGIPSTLTSVNMQIWDGDPSDVGSSIVWGDTLTNVMASTDWTNIYRVLDSTSGTTNRAIMEAVVTVNTVLDAGTYWIDYQIDGSITSGPWAPPITIDGEINTGNALDFFSGAWNPVTDSGSTGIQGMPFLVEGSLVAPTDVSFAGFSGNAASSKAPIIIGLLVLTALAGAIVVRRQMVR